MALLPQAAAAAPIRQAIAACRRHFVNAAIFSAFLNVLYLAPTLYMLQVYDRVVPTRGVTTLVMLTLIFVAAVATISLLDLVRTRLLVRASERLDRMLSAYILEALLQTSTNSNGARNAVVLREFDVFRQTMTGVGVLALFDAPWAPIYVLVCFLIHPALGAMALVGALVLSLLSWLNERATSAPIKDANIRAQTAYTGIDLSLGSAGVIGALGMREAMVRRHLRERFEGTALTTQAGYKSSGYGSFVKGIRLLLQSLALGLGALLAIEQQISAGAIFAASLLISRALAPIELINGAWKNLIQSRAAYRQIVDLFERRGPVVTPTVMPAPSGALSIEGLTVASPAQDRALISGVTFALAPGELLGIIGPSGAGKSTLVKAMVGVLPAASGAVRLDGADLRNWPQEQLGAAIGYVPQEPVLFRGTIKENIARFRTEMEGPGALDEEVVTAAQLCGAHDFIVRLPQGYDTELGWAGSGLSVGQAQRVTLARALLGAPSVVILDEPNASLDAEGEARLAQALAVLRERGVTVVCVAHRAGILANADKLLFMRNGRAEMFGSRDEVLATLNAPPTVTGPRGPAAAGAPPAGATTVTPPATPPVTPAQPAASGEAVEPSGADTAEVR
ncbi:MAG: type I secretion system permease/ATPase [Sphingomonas adhaesiva]|uniref:type I secretion system permease/ATPase n=1 Tax=Sphingomonas adhaesiva TaxID=28212 RepID=UPI002FFBB306